MSIKSRLDKLERAHGTDPGACTCNPGAYRIQDTRAWRGDEGETPGPPLTDDGRCSVCGGEVVVVRIVEVDDWRATNGQP